MKLTPMLLFVLGLGLIVIVRYNAMWRGSANVRETST